MDFSMDESPAVEALGSLFKLTEVQLWDDGSSEVQVLPYCQESIKISNGDDDYGQRDYGRTNGFSLLPEDLELAKQMTDLGLPVSFHTNKETYGWKSIKRKAPRKSEHQCLIEIEDYMLDSTTASEGKSASPILLNSSKLPDQRDMLKNGIMAEIDGLSNLSLEQGVSLGSTACTSTVSNEHEYNGEVADLVFDDGFSCSSRLGNKMLDDIDFNACTNEMMAVDQVLDCGHSERSFLLYEGAGGDGKEIKGELNSLNLEAVSVMGHETEGQSNDTSLEVVKDSEAVACAQVSEQANCNLINNCQIADFGEWIAYWDDFHMRTYFYNVETMESTWDPPSGMEHLVYGNITDEPTGTVAGLSEFDCDQMDFRMCDEVQASSYLLSHDSDKESRNDAQSLSQQLDGTAGNGLSTEDVFRTKSKNKKKKSRKTSSNMKPSISSEDLQEVLYEVPASVSKYWHQRYLLFSRFDKGIKMDEEGWFSVTPETIAKHHAVRCGHGTIVDLFTGVGGNAIQFAKWSQHVIAIDIDPIKIDYARHNAAIYGVDDRIDFIMGDSYSLAPNLKANTVFMSPPWGGPDYSKVNKFDMYTMLKPRDGQFLFNAGKTIAPKVVMFLPKNVDINQLAELSLSATPPWSLEVERNFLNGKLKTITAYFSEPATS